MVYVEPEVVNPPKEQSVPQFNKKEIIAIIKEAQEVGLLPSGGGTKLYKHTIHLTSSEDEIVDDFYLISNSPTPLTANAEYNGDNTIAYGRGVDNYNEAYVYILFFEIELGEQYNASFVTLGEEQRVDYYFPILTLTDTVTEL